MGAKAIAVTPSAESNAFSAASSALGYLAQIEYALLLILRRMDTDMDFDVGIETLDDVVFHPGGGEPVELLQAKHRVDRTASLTNASTDIWKTLHNWIVSAPAGASLTLITNAAAGLGTAAEQLRPGSDRNVRAALRTLETTARTSENAAHKAYYEAFLGLPPEARFSLLERTFILDQAAAVSDVRPHLDLALRKASRPAHREALIDRLRGWWYQIVYEHLMLVASGTFHRISAFEVEGKILAVAQSLRDQDLPIDFYDMPEPSEGEVAEDDRVFVSQLRLIALSNARLRQCIYDHNRAFAQRSRWEREKLVHVGELKLFESRLKDEWRRFCTDETDDHAEVEEQVLKQRARDHFLQLERSNLPRIRAHVEASFVAVGSLHILADRLEIGWHPAWLDRLRTLLPNLDSEAGVA